MSYPRKIELWKPRRRASTQADKDRRGKASAAWIRYAKGEGVFTPAPLKDGETSWLKRMWETMSNWRSKKSIEDERKLEEKLARERARQKKEEEAAK